MNKCPHCGYDSDELERHAREMCKLYSELPPEIVAKIPTSAFASKRVFIWGKLWALESDGKWRKLKGS